MSEDPNRKRRQDLETSIRETLDLIKQYEDKRRLSDDPREQRDSERQISDLRQLLEEYHAELAELESTINTTAVPSELHRILDTIKQSRTTFDVRVWTGVQPDMRDVAVEPKHHRMSYRVGEKIYVYFWCNRDCFLTLINVGTTGNVTVLFPNNMVYDSAIHSGIVWRFPREHDPFDYKLIGPPGVETIKAIATVKPVALIDIPVAERERIFQTLPSDQATRDILIVRRKVLSLRTDEWAEATCAFAVEEALPCGVG